jgi:hypothetical protein
MAFEQETYNGDFELSSVPNALACKRDDIGGSFKCGSRRRNSAGGRRHGGRCGGACLDLTGATSAHVSPRASGGRVNEVDTWSEDTPDRAYLTLMFSLEPGFSSSWEATLDDVLPVPRSFDTVDQ